MEGLSVETGWWCLLQESQEKGKLSASVTFSTDASKYSTLNLSFILGTRRAFVILMKKRTKAPLPR